ncbi:MAG: tetratricopeptide repeat protein [Spirochaetes bacterium]|nr:tetratricopeptide repeat protein [Spirochaetota bacterium]
MNAQLDLILDVIIGIYRAVGLQGLGAALVIVIAATWTSLFLRRRLNPYRRAQSFYGAGNLKRAFSLLLIELEKNPGNKQAALMRADIHTAREEYAEAESWYYRLIYQKKPGDGIDTFWVRKKLLKPLYHRQKLLDLLNLAREILDSEKNCPEALYYLGLLYMGQLYYREANTILDRLVKVRPRMHEALFAQAVALIQLNKDSAAVVALRRAIEIRGDILYELVLSFAMYLSEDYAGCRELLSAMGLDVGKFETERQYLFALRLRAFCDVMLGNTEDSVETFKEIAGIVGQKKGQPSKKITKEEIAIYNEFGRVQQSPKKVETRGEAGEVSVTGDYYRLKEFLIEEKKDKSLPRDSLASSTRFLDVEGLNAGTWASLDLGLAMVSGDMLEDAVAFFEDLKRAHPELVGLKRLVDIVRKKHAGDVPDTGTEQRPEKKRGGRDLDEYLAVWKRYGIRPYAIMLITEFSAKKQLNPLVMFSRNGRFALDL